MSQARPLGLQPRRRTYLVCEISEPLRLGGTLAVLGPSLASWGKLVATLDSGGNMSCTSKESKDPRCKRGPKSCFGASAAFQVHYMNQ